MSLLSQVLSLAFNLINLPFAVEGRSDTSIFPFDVLRNMTEPCTTILFEMGENELKFTALPRGLCSNCCPTKMQRDVRFMLYTKSHPDTGGLIHPFKPGAARRVGANNQLPTVIFIHGFSEATPGQSGQAILNAYLSRSEAYNLILLDWSELASFPWYATAVANIKHVARRLKTFIEVFQDSGELPIGNLHVIGFSLGCHIAGMAGKMLRQGLRIPRITGLDPALPEFSLTDTSTRLTQSDAEYVDVIHTDSGIFGFPVSIGHADFYPNGGRALQPGCQPSYLVQQRLVNQVLACSHVRAWRLYAESVVNENAFPATKCKMWRGLNKRCQFTIDAYMGYSNKNTDEFQKSIQVCLLGAHSSLGRFTSLLMKQNPIISTLKLHGDHLMQNLVTDLNQMDTPCKVQGFDGCKEIGKALRGADIVIMLGYENLKEDTPMADRILAEGRKVYDLTNEFINYSPRAILIVNVSPISVMTPFVANIVKQTHWYHPGRIIGSTALSQMKINTVFGKYQHLDPHMCQVPIIGGPDVDVAVPLFSKAKPLEINDHTAEPMMAIFRGLKPSDFPKKTHREDYLEKCTAGEAFALNTMVSTIGMGLCGDKEAYYTGFVRSNLIDTCRHLVTVLQFSRGGVVYNTGIPQLSKLELQMFEKVLLKIKEREEMAQQLLDFIEKDSRNPPSFKQKDMEKRKLLQQTIIQ